jgi:DNA-binding transcriptional MerR regulator
VLTFIRLGRGLGLSLDAIAEIIDISKRGSPCDRTTALLTQRLAEIDAAIADLRRLRKTITNAQQMTVDQSSAIRCPLIEAN